MKTLQHKIGDVVRMTANRHGHGFEIGDEVEITERFDVNKESAHYGGVLKSNPDQTWYFRDYECEAITQPTSPVYQNEAEFMLELYSILRRYEAQDHKASSMRQTVSDVVELVGGYTSQP